MIRGNNILGILFANVHEEKIRELTEKRTMGSVPFGGRYRLIDFRCQIWSILALTRSVLSQRAIINP